MKKTMKSTLRLAALALVAAYGISCCGGAKKACNTACGADCACGDSCACTAACAVDSAKLALQVYDPNQPLNLQDMNLFLEYDKTDTIKVSETVTRKFIYLNDLMTVISTTARWRSPILPIRILPSRSATWRSASATSTSATVRYSTSRPAIFSLCRAMCRTL